MIFFFRGKRGINGAGVKGKSWKKTGRGLRGKVGKRRQGLKGKIRKTEQDLRGKVKKPLEFKEESQTPPHFSH